MTRLEGDLWADGGAVSSIRRYVEALGGRLSMEMDLPEGRRVLA